MRKLLITGVSFLALSLSGAAFAGGGGGSSGNDGGNGGSAADGGTGGGVSSSDAGGASGGLGDSGVTAEDTDSEEGLSTDSQTAAPVEGISGGDSTTTTDRQNCPPGATDTRDCNVQQ